MIFFRDLGVLSRFSGFRWLLSVRLLSQCSDGIFQVALASTILFSPERAPTAAGIAVAFATILLPFTVLGPFVGVFLDRWPRRRILIASNAVRAILLLLITPLAVGGDANWLFYVLVLACFSVNRFLLAGLSASLPHVISRELLVTANAVSPTSGTLAYIGGLALGGAVHAATKGDGMVLVVGSVSYVLSALLALRLPHLGPDRDGMEGAVRGALARVVYDVGDAARHLPGLGRLALGVVAAGQLPYGVMIVGTILFSRSDAQRGLAGFGVVVGAAGVGYAVAALVTPSMTARFGIHGFVTSLSVLAAVTMFLPAQILTQWAVAITAFGLGISNQGVKICVDTTLQRIVGDIYRGRAFALYDVLMNAMFVAATALAALVLPTDGLTHAVFASASLAYLVIACTVWRCWPPPDHRPDPGLTSVAVPLI